MGHYRYKFLAKRKLFLTNTPAYFAAAEFYGDEKSYSIDTRVGVTTLNLRMNKKARVFVTVKSFHHSLM